jgi:hypothetical protein
MNTLALFFKKTQVAVIGIFFALLMLAGALAFHEVHAQTATGNVTGDLWSSTIGRISLNCQTGGATGQSVCGSGSSGVNYGVNVVPNTTTQTGAFSGYAWSAYVGWVSFNAADVGACGSGSSAGAPATIDFTNGAVTGWIRAISGSSASGWDGCISLSGTGYGVSYNSSLATNNLTGFAWGDVNAGWVGFTGATLTLSSSHVDLKANGSDSLNLPPYGGAVVLTWVGTNIASTSCNATGDWSGSKTPSAGGTEPSITLPVNTTSTAVSYSYTLSCIGTNASTVSDTVIVTVAPGGGSGNAPFLSLKANNVPAGALSSPGVVSVFPGDTVNFQWETVHIQPNSCVGQISTNAMDLNWTTGNLDSTDTSTTTGPHTYSISSVTANPTDRTYSMHGCLDFTNNVVPDQAITIHILPPPTCKVVTSAGISSAVITVPSAGLVNKSVAFGIKWLNTKGFFPATLSLPGLGGAGAPTVHITNQNISLPTSSATVTVSSTAITAPMTIPITITGTPSTGAPASSCIAGTITLVAPGSCNDACADPSSYGGPQCVYNAQHPRGCATKKAPWEEF